MTSRNKYQSDRHENFIKGGPVLTPGLSILFIIKIVHEVQI